MYDIGDDNVLDELSRDAARQPLAPGKPDWNALQKRLDTVLPLEKRKRRIIAWWWLPLGVCILALGYKIIRYQAGTTKPSSAITKLPARKITVPAPIRVTAPASATAAAKKQNDQGATSGGSLITGISKPVIVKPSTVTGSVKLFPENKETTGASIPKVETSSLTTEKKPQPANTTNVVTGLVKEPATAKPEKETLEQPVTVNNSTLDSGNATPVAEHAPDSTQGTQSLVKIQPAKGGRGFSFGLIAGIDKSTVKFTYDKGPGYNLGFELGYHFNNRWSLHTGAIYTRKNYKMEGEDFTAPKGSWISNYKLENVDGYCRMWEVPLELRMILNPGSRNKQFFIATGLSSYFMTHENYTYTYYYNSNLASRNSDLSSSDTHVFSILDLSAGVQKKWGNKTYLLIEPYARIPMGGVGFGNIRLSSFGINLGIQWRNVKKH